MGPQGIRDVGELCLSKSHYAARKIAALDGYRSAHDAPFFKEFVVECPVSADEVTCETWKEGIQPGVPLSRWFPDRENQLLVAVTEKKTRAEIDALADALGRVNGGGPRAASRSRPADGGDR